MYSFVQTETSAEGVVTVTLDRAPVNAVSDEFAAELHRVADDLAADPGARVVVLRSSQKVFMAGADLDVIRSGWDDLETRITTFQRTYDAWERLPIPAIAVIEGHALGAGCELALSCDWRFMARGRARIGLPEVRHGLLPSAGGTQRAARLLGRARALDLTLRGRLLDADEASDWGLVSAACDADDVLAEVDSLARELVALPRLTLAAIKHSVVAGIDTDLRSGLDIECQQMVALGSTHDTREGVQAFIDKRPPVFEHH